MAERKNGKGTTVVKSLDDVDFTKGKPAEIVLDDASESNEITYEGGELDGQTGVAAAEDSKMLERIEGRRAEAREAEAAKTEEAKREAAGGKEEEALPEIEVQEQAEGETGGETKAPEGETTSEAGETTEAEKSEYSPNLTYKAYGQEKTFPEWAAPLITSPEVEEQMRSTFAKADALETMQPKFQAACQDRDTFKGQNDEHIGRVNRLIELRSKAPDQFFEELGVSDDLILKKARRIVEANDPERPEIGRAYAAQRESERQFYAQQIAPPPQTQGPDPTAVTLHREAMTRTLAEPDVAAYRANFDKLHGEGSFDQQVNSVGSRIHATEKGRYASPSETTKAVMSHFGSVFANKPAPAAKAAAGGGAAPAPGKTSTAPARPKTVPRVGQGANASPTVKRLTSLDAVKAKVAAELNQ